MAIQNGKVYESIYLRESYRQGRKVKKRNISNLTHCPPEVIAAIELALKNKGDIATLKSLKEVELEEGHSVGAVWTVYEVAKGLGREKALGTGVAGKLAFWQVMARVIDQGLRLSAVSLARVHVACDALCMRTLPGCGSARSASSGACFRPAGAAESRSFFSTM